MGKLHQNIWTLFILDDNEKASGRCKNEPENIHVKITLHKTVKKQGFCPNAQRLPSKLFEITCSGEQREGFTKVQRMLWHSKNRMVIVITALCN